MKIMFYRFIFIGIISLIFSFIHLTNCVTVRYNCSKALQFISIKNFKVLNIIRPNDLVDNLNAVRNISSNSTLIFDLRCSTIAESIFISDSSIVNFKAIEKNNLIAVDFLSESNKKIRAIMFQIFDLNKIVNLYITKCSIERFNNQMIRHFKYLRTLYFDDLTWIKFDINYLNSMHELGQLWIKNIYIGSTENLKLNQTNSRNLIFLSLIYNQINYLERESFSMLTNLRNLLLSYNEISFLDDRTFENMIHLKNLDLSSNQIKEISSLAFHGLKKLTQLYLGSNQIEEINEEVFYPLESLRYLGIQGNNLKSLADIPFSRLKSLRHILSDGWIYDQNITKHANDCQMRDIGWEFVLNIKQQTSSANPNTNKVSFGCLNNFFSLALNFDSLNKSNENKVKVELDGILRLKELILNGNAVGNFKEFHLIANLTENMESLFLNNDTIAEIDSIEFKGVESLKKLDLSYNQIESIENVDFAGISELEHLNLRGNQIDLKVNKIARFKGIPKLKYLILAGNQIKTVNNVTFDGIESLEHLDLSGCQMKFLKNENKSIRFNGIPNLKQLILFGNPLEHIDTLYFDGIELLEYLDLSGCQIKSFENVTLIGIEQLKTLLLKINQIENLDTISINGVNNLEMLDLSYLELRSMNALSSKNLENLRSLKLNLNKINSFRFDLNGFSRLEELDLSYAIYLNLNSIDVINIELLNSTNTLKKLILVGIQLYGRILKINGANSLEYLDISQVYLFSFSDDRFQICCPKSNKFTIIMKESEICILNPKNFSTNFRLIYDHYQKYLPFFFPIKYLYEPYPMQTFFYYQYPSNMNLFGVCNNSHLFLVRKFKKNRFYTSIPIRYENHETTQINCTLILAFFRKCFLARYLIGLKKQTHLFLDKCISENLDPFFKIN